MSGKSGGPRKREACVAGHEANRTVVVVATWDTREAGLGPEPGAPGSMALPSGSRKPDLVLFEKLVAVLLFDPVKQATEKRFLHLFQS